jgi:hypothetical protein
MLPEEVEPAPESVTVPPAAMVEGVAVRIAVGGACTVTEAMAGALCTPRLSVTTREKVTVPEAFGTATEMVGVAVLTLGLAGESTLADGTGADGAGVAWIPGCRPGADALSGGIMIFLRGLSLREQCKAEDVRVRLIKSIVYGISFGKHDSGRFSAVF